MRRKAEARVFQLTIVFCYLAVEPSHQPTTELLMPFHVNVIVVEAKLMVVSSFGKIDAHAPHAAPTAYDSYVLLTKEAAHSTKSNLSEEI